MSGLPEDSRSLTLDDLIGPLVPDPRSREQRFDEARRVLFGRVYHKKSQFLGLLVFSDIVTNQGVDLYSRAADGLSGFIVQADPTGELSGRQDEAQSLPESFTLVHVDGTWSDEPFWDQLDALIDPDPAVDLYVDTGATPIEPVTAGTLTPRAVYGVLRVPVRVRSEE